jgi:hypothetical protein
VWFGTQARAGRSPEDEDVSWMPVIPVYFGTSPLRNRNSDYQDFMQRVQAARQAQGKEPWEDFPDYAAEQMADSIISLVKALSLTPPEKRRNGAFITSNLRNLVFDGVSGSVNFTPEGDR